MSDEIPAVTVFVVEHRSAEHRDGPWGEWQPENGAHVAVGYQPHMLPGEGDPFEEVEDWDDDNRMTYVWRQKRVVAYVPQSRIAALEKELEGERGAWAQWADAAEALAVPASQHWMVRPDKRESPKCKACSAQLFRVAKMFHWRGRDFHGLVCATCKALYDDPTDSFAQHVGLTPPASDRAPEMKPTDDGERR